MPDDAAADAEAIVAAVEAGSDGIAVPAPLLEEPPANAPAPPQSLFAQVLGMTMGEKIKLALRGNKDARTILLRDRDRLVRRLVLQNPRFSDAEAIQVCRNRSADDEALRYIGNQREFMRNYQIRLTLATNPKTPLVIAMKILPTLGERDLRQLAKSKNVPQVIAVQCRRMIHTMTPGGGGPGHG
jgi:hypothetical protein